MAREKKLGGESPSGTEWLATFSDTMTLLLTFFILLYSFSTVDQKKLDSISSALQTVLTGQAGDAILDFGLKYGQVPIVGESQDESVVPLENGINEKSMYQKVKEFVEKNNMETVVQIKEDTRGIVIQLRDNILFESGNASLKDNSKPILDKISSLISNIDNDIIVEGHTDNVPISNYKYESNWELSSSRAGSVVRFFTDIKRLPIQRFSCAGYAETKPVVSNDTNEHRAMNRRVNILIVASEKEKQ